MGRSQPRPTNFWFDHSMHCWGELKSLRAESFGEVSSVFYTQSAVCGPQSAVHCLQFIFYTNTNINFITETRLCYPTPKVN